MLQYFKQRIILTIFSSYIDFERILNDTIFFDLRYLLLSLYFFSVQRILRAAHWTLSQSQSLSESQSQSPMNASLAAT